MPSDPKQRRESRNRKARLAGELSKAAAEIRSRLDAWRALSSDRDREREGFLAGPYDSSLWAKSPYEVSRLVDPPDRRILWFGGLTAEGKIIPGAENAEIDAAVERWVARAMAAAADPARHIRRGIGRVALLDPEDQKLAERWPKLADVVSREAAEILSGPQPRTIAEIAAHARRQADAVYQAHQLPHGHTAYAIRERDQLERPSEWVPSDELFLGLPPLPIDGFCSTVTPSEVAIRVPPDFDSAVWPAGAVHEAVEVLGRLCRSSDTPDRMHAALVLAGMALQRAMTDLEMETRPSQHAGGRTKQEAVAAAELEIRQRTMKAKKRGAKGVLVRRRKGDPVRTKAREIIAKPGNADISLKQCAKLVADEFPDREDSTIRGIIKELFEKRPNGPGWWPKRAMGGEVET